MVKERSASVLAAASVVANLCVLAVLATSGGEWTLTGAIIACAAGVALVAGLVLATMARPSKGLSRSTQHQLIAQAHTDSLTGLRNHRAFHEDLAREMAIADARGQSVGLVLLDVDGLKVTNDRHGHQAGDHLITSVATTLQQHIRRQERAYRIGGDEFAVILPGETTWGAFRFAQRLQSGFGVLPSGRPISAAAGVSAFRGQTRDELIREADLALIAAKRGRRGALIYTDDLAVREQGYHNSERTDHLDLLCSALARAVDVNDSSTRGHSEMVAELCGQIATELGLDSEHIARIRRAGLLHDVGKIGIAESILLKPGPLTDDEQAVMRTHAVLGRQIITGTGLDDEAGWILHHHERLDGYGYPAGLAGAQIPLESAIIHVADAFEAMTADRPYRRARDIESALVEIDHHTGTQFHPAAAAALRAVVQADSFESHETTSFLQDHPEVSVAGGRRDG